MGGNLLERLIGHTVDGYYLEQLVSYGQVSTTYQARHLALNRPMTLTLLALPEDTPTQLYQQFRARFLQEAPALVKVRHPHLLPLDACGEWEGFFYLVTPPLPQRSLATILKQQGPCAPGTALTILEQITAGLEHAHRKGLVHGVLTPSHLLVSQDQRIQIAGIGLQHLHEGGGMLPVAAARAYSLILADTCSVVPRYLAPECLQQGLTADIRSDVYSLGVILGELLIGMPPGSRASFLKPPTEQDAHFPRFLEHALAVDPGKRFQRVSELLAAFAEELEAERSAKANACWSCPLYPAVGSTEPEARQQMQEDEFPGSTSSSRKVPHTAAPVEAPARFVRSQPLHQRIKRFLARYRMRARRGRAYAHWSRKIRRRRMLGLLVKGGALGVLGVGVVSTGYLLTTALLKPPLPQKSTMGHSQQALNTAQVFTNPRDGQQGLLVHLPNGTFVAYERSCTHIGVYVNYNSQTHMLVCPAHGAIFDPAHAGRVIRGPASRPLPQVPISPGSNGTILIGDSGAVPHHEKG